MKKGAACAVAVLTAITPLSACTNQNSGQPTTSPSSSAPPGTERMTTQLKGADGSQVGTATIEFANGYATVTVEAGPNQVLTPVSTPCKSTPWANAKARRGLRIRRRCVPGAQPHGLSRQRRTDRFAGAQRRLGETGHHQHLVHRRGPAEQLGHCTGDPPDCAEPGRRPGRRQR